MTEARPDTVALPERGDGSRRARHGRPPRVRRRLPIRWIAGVGAVAVLAVLAVLAVVAVRLVDGDDEVPAPATAEEEAVEAEADRSLAAVLVRALDGTLVASTLLLADELDPGGDLLHVPPGTMVEVPALGLVPLREAAAQSPDLAVAAVENLLGVRVVDVAVLGPAELEQALRPVGSIEVDLPAEVEQRVGDRITTAFPPGRQRVSPAQAFDVLALPGGTDLDRLVRHQALWDGWLAALAGDPSARPPRTVLGGVADRLSRLAGGPVGHHVLPVAAVDADGGLYRVDEDGLGRLLGRLLPSAPDPASRIDVRVLNGTGAPGVGQALVGPLVDAGARIALTGNADRFDHEVTQVVYYDDAARDAAERVRAALGVGEVVKSRARIGVVDVTVVVGRDFPVGATGTTSGTSEGASP